jgi:hypothetical protein
LQKKRCLKKCEKCCERRDIEEKKIDIMKFVAEKNMMIKIVFASLRGEELR